MYAVLDTETTGLHPGWHHRVIEIGVVLVDSEGIIEREWCTLVNADRDLGPQHIHGISAAEVSSAPSFADIAGYFLSLVQGRVLVAHNLPFDLAFIKAEFDRLGVEVPLSPDFGVCTMTWASRFLPGAGRSLRDCCETANVPLVGWHSAGADATATAGLLARYIHASRPTVPWPQAISRAQSAYWPKLDIRQFSPYTRSTGNPAPEETFVSRLVDYMPRVDTSELADPYLAVLDEALSDRYLSADEVSALRALAQYLGLTDTEVALLHRNYLDALARIALADEHLSDDEKADLDRVAAILGLPHGAVAAALERAGNMNGPIAQAGSLPIQAGDMIVFTGDMAEPREVWMQRAAEHGFVPHPNITKNIKLVVAADADTLSGKAKKARGYGIPIMSIDAFRQALGYAEPASHGRATASTSIDERAWARILNAEQA